MARWVPQSGPADTARSAAPTHPSTTTAPRSPPKLSAVPASDNGFHTDAATGILTPNTLDGDYYTLSPDGAKSFFDKEGHPITEDTYTKNAPPPAPQDGLGTDEELSGKAADAIATLHDELNKQYSTISDAEEGLSQVLLTAHATTAAGQQQLSQIQAKIIDAVNNPSMSIDTPAGQRSFLTFLHTQISAINDLLTSVSLIADDQAKTARALSRLYAVDGSSTGTPAPDTPPPQRPGDPPSPTTPAAAGDAATPADSGSAPPEPPLSDALDGEPVGTALGADPFSSLAPGLPSAASGLGGSPLDGLGGTPLDGLGGLAGAIAQLAQSASQANDHASDHDHSPDTADKTDTVGAGSDTADKQPGHTDDMPAAGDPPPPLTPASAPTDTVQLPDGSSAMARTPAAAQAVRAYLGGDTIDAAYSKNNLALPPPGTPVTSPVDPNELACGDVGIFRDHYVVALSSVKALANGQVVALSSVASSPDFLGWIDPTATAAGPRPAPSPPASPPSQAPEALADALPPVPAS